MQKTEELFQKWNADRRAGTFESRLLANRLKARFGCTLDVAYQAMGALRPEDTFQKLVLEVRAMHVPALPPRSKSSSRPEFSAPAIKQSAPLQATHTEPSNLNNWLAQPARAPAHDFKDEDGGGSS